jgi:ribosome-associated translation inhibitor RaiA
MADQQSMQVDITAAPGVPRGQMHDARRMLISLQRVAPRPLVAARLTLRPGTSSSVGPPILYVADATLPFDGRLLAAHATGPTALQAAEAAVERLRRQLRRVRDSEVAQRNDPRVIAAALRDLQGLGRPPVRFKPPEERDVVHRHTYAPTPEPTLTAIADLLDDDEDFHLFVHVRTNEDVVVHWTDDRTIGLLFPPGSVLGDEGDLLDPEPSRYTEPLPMVTARAEMDALNHRFLYFIDAEDERGKVLYLRLDGDYGLVEPQ